MKYLKLTLLLTILALITAQNAFPQNNRKLSKLDQTIQAGFDALKARKWSEAVKSFEDAQKIHEKDKQPSVMLFTLFTLPDEDPSVPPGDETEKQIMDFRHSMATKQALLQFLAYAHQLNGNSGEAQKYHQAVYDLRGVFWGMSWRLFVPRFNGVFDDLVKTEKGENAGRYQYLAASLLLDATGEMESVFEMLKTAHQNAPKDADIAGLLANGYLQKRNPKEAKRLADLSLSLKPDQNRVLIDLATAEWLLGEFDNSIKHAEAAIKLDAEMPGPHLTLAMNYIEKKDFQRALKEADRAVNLSGGHPFYLTVQAAAFEASGDAKQAEKLLREAWTEKLPTFQDLDTWYVNETLRNLVLKIAKRLDKPGVDV